MILPDLIAAIVGGLLPTRAAKSASVNHTRGLRARGQADLAVRLLTGAVAGLGSDFRAGTWSVRAGEMSLGSIKVTVESVSPSHRAPTVREDFRVFRASRVYLAKGAGATFEIAIQESDADWAISVLLAGNALLGD